MYKRNLRAGGSSLEVGACEHGLKQTENLNTRGTKLGNRDARVVNVQRTKVSVGLL